MDKTYETMKGVTGLILLTILLVWVFGGFESSKDSASSGASHRMDAVVCAKNKVREQLKLPDEADFSRTNEQITELGNDKYEVKGAFTAKNLLGIEEETFFDCSVVVEDPDKLQCSTTCIVL